MTRRPRGLRPEERELWNRVVGAAHPLHPDHPRKVDPAEKAPPKKAPFQISPFRLGETAIPRPPAVDHAPTPTERLAAQTVRMDRGTHQKMLRGKTAPEARIDLHGMTLAEAQPELVRFILNAHASGLRLVLVITGKGKRDEDHGPIPARRGVLRHQVPHWLNLPPLSAAVLQVASAHLKHGGEGAYYVYLRRAR